MAYRYPGKQVDLGGGRGWLDTAPAASLKRVDAALGHRLQVTEAGRSFFRQEEHWLKYLRDGYPIALNPNTPSVHQKGAAIDSDEAQRHIALMAEHGWIRTVYRWVNGVWTLVERWHFEYFIDRDKHRYDGVPTTGGTKKVYKNTQDKKSRSVGRTLEPDDAFFLNTDAKGAANRASDIAVVGQTAFAIHVYATGAAGDVLEVALWWGKGSAESPHYKQRLVIPPGGKLEENFGFIRPVAKGQNVYAKMVSPKTNKGNVRVTLFDSDAAA